MTIDIEVTVLSETERALRVVVHESREEHWIPKSQIVFDLSDPLEVGASGTMAITDWVAKEKGLD